MYIYKLVFPSQKHKYLLNIFIFIVVIITGVFAVAIDLCPKRLIHTRDGSETYVQDVVLIDRKLVTSLFILYTAHFTQNNII